MNILGVNLDVVPVHTSILYKNAHTHHMNIDIYNNLHMRPWSKFRYLQTAILRQLFKSTFVNLSRALRLSLVELSC